VRPQQPHQGIQKMQAQIAALQAELQVLQERSSALPVPAMPTPVMNEGKDDDLDLSPGSQNFSRQSTEEGPAQEGSCGMLLSEHDDDASLWGGDFEFDVPLAEAKMEEGRELEEAIPCELVVQNSFLSLVPSASAPPARRRRCASEPPKH